MVAKRNGCMTISRTETTHASAEGFDLRPPAEALDILVTAQLGAAWAVRSALEAIAAASELMAETIAGGGAIAYAAAGSSAYMAMADALELPGTYGIARQRIKLLVAGGATIFDDPVGGPEDDGQQAAREVAKVGIGRGDCLIAISASGTTPYALLAEATARDRGARTIGMANNADAPLLQAADIAICLATAAEVIAGSTRMGAGTAQKIALNMMSTMMATRLGHVHDGHMVNLVADNDKLRMRARRIVRAVARCDEARATASLETAGGAVKPAILLAAGASDLVAAQSLLARGEQKLRAALALLAQER
jgi:N-acetylmuramic acid 6-phosphate etherase